MTLTHSGSVQMCDTRTRGFGLVHSPVGVCGSVGISAKGQLCSGSYLDKEWTSSPPVRYDKEWARLISQVGEKVDYYHSR